MNLISVIEPEVFQPEAKFCPGNGMATFVDSPPIDRPSCVPAPGPVHCSLQGTSTDFYLHSSKLWDFFSLIFSSLLPIAFCKWCKKWVLKSLLVFLGESLGLAFSFSVLYYCIKPIQSAFIFCQSYEVLAACTL